MSTIKLRRDTAANWTAANPVLSLAEPGLETDTQKVKYGDGVTTWVNLPYASGGGSIGPVFQLTSSTAVLSLSSTGTLTLPTGYSIGGNTNGNDGIALTTDRGTVLFGNHPEQCTPTQSSHFHIMRNDPTTVDLFFGDDYNYVKLPYTSTLTNVGVEIGTDATNQWKFGTDGVLTMPDGNNGGNGAINFTWEGNNWASISSSESTLNLYSLDVGGSGPKTNVRIGFDVELTTNLLDSAYTWTFGTDGVLTLPNGQLDYNAPYARFKYDTTATGAGVQLGSPDDQNYVNVDNGAVTIQVNSDGPTGPHALPQHNWIFGTDGTLTAPQTYINEDGSIIPRIDAVATLGTLTNAWDQIHVNNIKTRGNLDIATGGEYSYWYSVYENIPNNGAVFANSVSYDSNGNLYTFGGVYDSNTSHIDSLALKYDPDGNLVWRKAWIDPDGNPCGTYNQTIYIDSNDVIYWTSVGIINTGSTYVGTMDVDGNINETSTRLDNFVTNGIAANAGNGQVYLAGFSTPNVYNQPTVVSVDPGSTANWTFTLPEIGGNYYFTGIDFDSELGVYAAGFTDIGLGYNVTTIYNLDPATGNVINSITLDVGTGAENGSIAVNNGSVYIALYVGEVNFVAKLTSDLSTVHWCQNVGGTNTTLLYDINFDSDNQVYIYGTANTLRLYMAQLNDSTGKPVWERTFGGDQANTELSNSGARSVSVYQNMSLAVSAYTEIDATNTTTSHAPSVVTLQLPLTGGTLGTYGSFTLSSYDAGYTTATVTATVFTTSTTVTSGLGTDTNFIPDTILVNPDYVPVRYEITPGEYGWRFDTNGNLNVPVDGQLGWGNTWPAVELSATTASVGVSLTYNANGTLSYIYLEDGESGPNAGIQFGETNWSWNYDGTMSFPNNYLDTGDQQLIIRNTNDTEIGWYNGDVQGIPNELIDSGFGTFYRGSYIANTYSNSDATGTNQTIWFFGGNPNTGGANNVLQIGTFNNDYEYEYDPGVDIQDANGNSLIYVATTSTAPGPRVEGQLWYNTIEGQLYIRHNDLWIDASPTVIPSPSTYLDGLTIDGTTISSVDTTGTVSIASNENVWTFSNTGTLVFPDGSEQTTAFTGTSNISFQYSHVLEGVSTNTGSNVTAIVGNNASVSESLVSNNYAQLQWITSGTAVTVDGIDIGYAHSAYNWAYVDSTGFNIENFPNGFANTFHKWQFGTDGILQMPPGNETTAGWIQWTHADDDLTNTAGIGFVDHYNIYTGLGLVAPTDTNAAKGIWFGTPTNPTDPFRPETSMVFRGDTLYLPKNGYIKSHDFDDSGYPAIGTTGTSITIQTAETTSTQNNWIFGADGSFTAPGPIYGGSNTIGLATPAPLNLNNTGPVGQSKTQLNLINTAGNGGTGSAIDYFTYVDQGNGLPGARLSAVDDDNYSANFSIRLKSRGNAGNGNLDSTVWLFGSDGNLTLPGLLQAPQKTITTSTATGVIGQMCWDDNNIYVYTSTGWKKSALTGI